MNTTPEGWYADPDDASRWRWWDGSAWTDQFSAPSGDRKLWTETTLWVVAKTGFAKWSAEVLAEDGRRAGTMRAGGNLGDMTLCDAGGAPQLGFVVDNIPRYGSGLLSTIVSDEAGVELGELALTKFVNKRVTVSIRSPVGEEAKLASEDKTTRAFAVHDAADQGVARVLQSRSGGGLVDKETTWQVTISRPLERASDPLVLAACLGLDFIQILAFNER